MAKLKIYSDIVDEEQKLCMESFGGPEGVCYKDVQEFIEAIPENDNTIDIRLHCCGGDCGEGWAIYDALRRSGKTISATVEGECSSIASVILLAAPAERRYANKNMRMCLHNPAYEYLMTDMPVRYTPDKLDALISDLEVQSKSLREEQDRILDLYVERTGANRKALQTLMDKDTFIDANRAQELGFITHILVPTTAHRFRKRNIKTKSNNKTMAKPNPTAGTPAKKPSALSRFLAKAGLARAKAQVVTAADGNEFTVEREDGDPQIGDVAYPDGTYVLDDGLKIVVEGEIITDIIQPETEGGNGDDPDPVDSMDDPDEIRAIIAELQGRLQEIDPDAAPEETAPQVEELQKTVEELQQTVEEQKTELKNARAIVAKVNKAGGMPWLDAALSMRSSFTPQNRRFVSHGAPAGKAQEEPTESKTQKAIRERREAAAAKRAKRN